MLDELHVGFKSYGETQRMRLAPLTGFIGANASGKSNFIEAAQLLTWIARSHRLSSLRHTLREGDLLARGRLEDLPAAGTHDLNFVAVVDPLSLSMTLSAVLAHLCREEGRETEVLAFIRALPEQDIRSVSFVETPRDEVMVQLEETFGPSSQRVPAELLSDGTLRVLAIAAAVLSVPEGTLVVIEEIDNGVHPARAAALMNALHAARSAEGYACW